MIRAKSALDVVMHELEISGRDLARSLDVSEQQVSRWRNGLRPGKQMRLKVADRLSKVSNGRKVTPTELGW